MKKPYIKIKEENETKIIYKKLWCHSFEFGESLDDKTYDKVYFIYIIKDNKKTSLNRIPTIIDKNVSIREHFGNIKKLHRDAYLDTEAFSVLNMGDTKDTIDIYFETY